MNDLKFYTKLYDDLRTVNEQILAMKAMIIPILNSIEEADGMDLPVMLSNIKAMATFIKAMATFSQIHSMLLQNCGTLMNDIQEKVSAYE